MKSKIRRLLDQVETIIDDATMFNTPERNESIKSNLKFKIRQAFVDSIEVKHGRR